MFARLLTLRTRLVRRWVALNGLSSDAALYSLSALFALVLGWTSTQVAQWHWGYLTVAPYAAAAIVAVVRTRTPPYSTSSRIGAACKPA